MTHEKQERIQGQGVATPGPWAQGRYGKIGFEIQGADGTVIAVVGRVHEKRLEFLNGVRSKAAKNGERAHQAEWEASEIEARDFLADAKLIAAAPELADALQVFVTFHSGHVLPAELGSAMTAARAALRKAGRE